MRSTCPLPLFLPLQAYNKIIIKKNNYLNPTWHVEPSFSSAQPRLHLPSALCIIDLSSTIHTLSSLDEGVASAPMANRQEGMTMAARPSHAVIVGIHGCTYGSGLGYYHLPTLAGLLLALGSWLGCLISVRRVVYNAQPVGSWFRSFCIVLQVLGSVLYGWRPWQNS
jgi:hypothetical protein